MGYTKALNHYLEFDPFRHKIQPDEHARLVSNLKLISLSIDETLYTPKSKADSFYYVSQGTLSLETTDGRLIIIKAGQYLGEEAALGLEFYISKATAKETALIIQFSAQDFQHVLSQNESLHKVVVTNYTQKFIPEQQAANRDKTSNSVKNSFSSEPLSTASKWILSLIIPLFVYIILRGTSVNQNVLLFLTFTSSAICLWTFSLVPPYIAAMLVVMISLALELAPREVILSSFASDLFLMLFSVFALGCALAQSTILYRMMLLILKFMPLTHFWTNTSIFILGAATTPFVPSSQTRQNMFQHFTKNLINQISLSYTGATATKIALSAYTAATLLSPIFLTSSLYNFFVLNLLNANQQRFRWYEWFSSALPTCILLLFFLALTLSLFFKEDEKPTPFRERVDTQLYLLRNVKNKDRGLIFLTLFYLLNLVISNYHGISGAYVSLIMVACLIIFNFITPAQLQAKLNWPSLFLFAFLGGIVSVFNWLDLSAIVMPVLETFTQILRNDFTLFALCLGLLLMIVRLFLPYGLVVVIASCLFIPFSQHQGFNPWLVGFLILLFSKESLFPTASSSLRCFMKPFSNDDAKLRTTLWKYHILINLIKFAAVYFSTSFWKDMSLI